MNDDEDLLARRLVIQGNILEAIKRANYHGKVDVPFRVGKSHIAVKSIASFKDSYNKDSEVPFKALWVTPQEELRDVDIPNTFKLEHREDLLPSTKAVCWSSLKNIEGEFTYIILDEYQYATTKNMENFFNGKIKYKAILCLTATPPKHWAKKEIIKRLKVAQIAYMSLDEAVGMEIVSDYRVKVIEFELDNIELRFKTKAGREITERERYDNLTYVIEDKKGSGQDASFLYHTRMRLLYQSKTRKDLILKLSKSQLLSSKRGLIFVPYKHIAEEIGPHYHSSSGDLDYLKFRDKEIDQLALVKSGGVGHTYDGIEYIAIAQATRDLSGFTSQSYGRGMMYKEGHLEIYILCCKDTVDETWVKEALSSLDKDKISYMKI